MTPRAAFILILIGMLALMSGCSEAPAPRPTEVLIDPAVTTTAALPVTGPQDVASPEPPSIQPTARITSQAAEPAACTAPAELTPAMTEGPYYTPSSPERVSLVEEGMPGTRLILTGRVLNQDCQPVPGAWLDFWQTDSLGFYDNQGYTLRGHQFTDEEGRYLLETVIPGEYPGRTPHIHVKVRAPEGPELTSQVFFPQSAANATDSIFDQQLVVTVTQSGDPLQAVFDFVILEQ